MKRLAWWLVLAALAGCASPTRFTGEPKFPGGLEGCRAACTKDGLEMGAFVYSGEYSTSCVCRPKSEAPPAAGADAAPTAGVEVQTQAAAAAAAAADNAYYQRPQQQSSSGAARH